MNHSKPPTDVAQDARAWQNVKKKYPGMAREELARIELGDRVVNADDTLNGGHP